MGCLLGVVVWLTTSSWFQIERLRYSQEGNLVRPKSYSLAAHVFSGQQGYFLCLVYCPTTPPEGIDSGLRGLNSGLRGLIGGGGTNGRMKKWRNKSLPLIYGTLFSLSHWSRGPKKHRTQVCILYKTDFHIIVQAAILNFGGSKPSFTFQKPN